MKLIINVSQVLGLNLIWRRQRIVSAPLVGAVGFCEGGIVRGREGMRETGRRRIRRRRGSGWRRRS